MGGRWWWCGVGMLAMSACTEEPPGELVEWSNQGRVCLSTTDRYPPTTPTGATGDTGTTTTTPTTTTPTATTTTADTGTSPSPALVIEHGDVIVASVTFGGCDCGDATVASCTATRDGDLWTITSTAQSLSECEPCEPIVATCELGVPAVGSHTFAHGGDRLIVEVPGELEPSCMGAPVMGEAL